MIEIKKLRTIVNKAFDSDKNKNNRKRMNRYLKYFTGQFWADMEKKSQWESGIFINLIFSTIMTIAPILTDNKPVWGLRARKPFFQKYLEVYKDAGDCLWDIEEMDMKLFDICLCSLIMKIGYFKVFFDPDREDGKGEVTISLVDPREFVMCPGYTDPWDAPWCGEKMLKPLDWIRRTFPEKGKEVKPENYQDDDNKLNIDEAEDYELTDQFAMIYHIWIKDDTAMTYLKTMADPETKEIKKKKVKEKSSSGSWIITFADNMDEPLEVKPYEYNHKKAPYVPLYDYKVPFRHMGMGEVDQLETLNLEYNLIAKKIAKHVKMYADPNWIVDAASGIDPELFKKELAGGGNVYTKLQGSDDPKQAQIAVFNPLGLQFFQSIPAAVEEVSGVTETSKGMSAKKQRQSAHEISALLETSYTRTRQRVRNLEWTIKRVYQLVIEIMQEYYTETRTFGRTTEEGHEWFNVSNNKEFALKMNEPQPPEQGMGQKDQTEIDQDNKNYEQAQKDYGALVEYLTDENSVYAKFDIIIETNSTLPLDKQSLANLCLQLAEIQLTPNSAIDLETLLEVLQFPHKDKVLKRLKAVQQQMVQQQQGGK